MLIQICIQGNRQIWSFSHHLLIGANELTNFRVNNFINVN